MPKHRIEATYKSGREEVLIMNSLFEATEAGKKLTALGATFEIKPERIVLWP